MQHVPGRPPETASMSQAQLLTEEDGQGFFTVRDKSGNAPNREPRSPNAHMRFCARRAGTESYYRAVEGNPDVTG